MFVSADILRLSLLALCLLAACAPGDVEPVRPQPQPPPVLPRFAAAHMDAADSPPLEEPPDEPPVDPPPDPPARTVASCFAGIASQTGVAPDYDQYRPVVASHCFGTDHQDITGIERVVFLGDSVTVGTPPSAADDVYRARLADALAARFSLQAPSALWKSANPLSGQAALRKSGDFWSCAKWGARTDDLLEDSNQLFDCFPENERHKKTLVVMTMGGNDIAAITKAGTQGRPLDEITADMHDIVAKFRAAVELLKDTTVFPGGVDVVFTNNFEFTDGTGDVNSCPAAAAAGFGEPWQDPEALARLVVWMMEQYLRIAVDTHSDMLFVLESFCGHGFHHDDPSNACYRGAGAERWFDLTCIHPNPTGHAVLADMFMRVVDE